LGQAESFEERIVGVDFQISLAGHLAKNAVLNEDTSEWDAGSPDFVADLGADEAHVEEHQPGHDDGSISLESQVEPSAVHVAVGVNDVWMNANRRTVVSLERFGHVATMDKQIAIGLGHILRRGGRDERETGITEEGKQ
jgi:hypothetical protein